MSDMVKCKGSELKKDQRAALYRVGNKFSDTLNVPFVSNWVMSAKSAVNCKF